MSNSPHSLWVNGLFSTRSASAVILTGTQREVLIQLEVKLATSWHLPFKMAVTAKTNKHGYNEPVLRILGQNRVSLCILGAGPVERAGVGDGLGRSCGPAGGRETIQRGQRGNGSAFLTAQIQSSTPIIALPSVPPSFCFLSLSVEG